MQSEPLFLESVLHEKIWGGTKLKTTFGFKIPSEHTGEAWLISGHKNGVVTVKNGPFAGLSLAQVWQQQPQLFENNDATQPFPLLVKMLDAKADLSVQVHPNDAYAKVHAHDLGKTECWYILAAEPGAKLYYGHTAKTQAEFDEMLDQHAWQKLFRTVAVKAGDFVYVPAGTLHALGAGILALETQQSSDVTYRVYDFDRVDETTNTKRALHLADAKAVTTIPAPPAEIINTQDNHQNILPLAHEKYFDVFHWLITDSYAFKKHAPYTLVTIIAGAGKLIIGNNTYSLTKGVSFILPANITTWRIETTTKIEAIASNANQ